MSDNRELITTTCFKTTGEYLTSHLRKLWAEGSYTKAINLLKNELSQDQIKAIIEGEYKLDGTNDMTLLPDDWDAFKEYKNYPSWHDVLTVTKELQEKDEIDDEFLNLVLPQKDNKMQSKCGWLLPNGDYYGCNYTGHWKLADDLLYNKDDDAKGIDAEKKAETLGWVKLTGTNERIWFFKKLTQKQINKLFDYCIVHNLDYNTTILPRITAFT